MSEPLKGKREGSKNNIDYWYGEKNIKSAVEWLKENIKTRDIPKGKLLVLEIIDKAFEDVTKK